MVFGEAAALGTAILTTRTSSADELVGNRGLGYVCDNGEEGLASLICAVLRGEKSLNCKPVKDINHNAMAEMLDLLNLSEQAAKVTR